MSELCPVQAGSARFPQNTALVFGGRSWSYAMLDGWVSHWCQVLQRQGVGAGDRVALLAHNRPEIVALFFAVRRLGAALAPLNARLGALELAPLWTRLEPKLTLADATLSAHLPAARSFEEVEQSVACGAPLLQPLRLSDTWLILFTSGTTGAPKAAELTVANLEASANASGENLGAGTDERWLCTLPLFHVGGLAMVSRCARAAATLVLAPRFEPLAVRRALEEHRITHTSLVPSMLQALLDAAEAPPRHTLRALLLGGGPASEALRAQARDAGVPVLMTYGLTEATSQVTTEKPGASDGRSSGMPLPGVEVRIVDSARRPLAFGEEGEIEVRGPTVMAGYFGDPAATAQSLPDGWLRTWDLGQQAPDGRLTVHARRRDLILSGGENVYPVEVEAVVSLHPGVLEVAVFGARDAKWGQVPAAFIVEKPGAKVTDEELSGFCRERLAGFKVPRRFERVEALPRNAMGKVDRQSLQLPEDAVPLTAPQVNVMDLGFDASEFLQQVEVELERALVPKDAERGRSDTLVTASRHLCIGGGGKRIRPLMARMFGLACGAPEPLVLHVAVAAELVHSASLLHDDVVDGGMFRRSRPTVNALWGNIVAVMSGDLLLCVALRQLSCVDRQVTFDAVETVAEMTEATIAEVEARGDLSLPFERFRTIAEGKTGALFGFCGASAALIAGKPDVALRFNAFGRHLGVAFQIADDLKDLNGGDPGKPQFADFRSRTASLPILIAAQADDALRRRIKDLWAFGSMPDEKVKELGHAVLASAAPVLAEAHMQTEIAAALDALGPFAGEPGGVSLKHWAQRLAEEFRREVST